MVIDGAAVIIKLKPRAARTFSDYAEQVFLPSLMKKLQHIKRLDIVWDQHLTNSLKTTAGENLMKGVRGRVTSHNKPPGNLADSINLLPNDENK